MQNPTVSFQTTNIIGGAEIQVIHAIYFNSGQKTHALWQAVLLEQFFMDNKKDFAYLISDKGKRNLIDVIVGGVNMLHTQKFQDFIKIWELNLSFPLEMLIITSTQVVLTRDLW